MADEEDEDILFDQSSVSLLNADISITPARSGECSRRKVVSTACLCAGFFGLGLCIALPGPTLLDLQQRTHTNTEQITWIFTGRSIGYLMGSVLGGFMFDRLNGNLLLSISMLLTAVATAILPWSKDFRLLVTLVGFQGLSMGSLDTGGNVVCVNTWGKNSGPYMQAMHFTFGLGAFVAPFVAEPFLTPIALNGSELSTANISELNVVLSTPMIITHRRARRDAEKNYTSPTIRTSTEFNATTNAPVAKSKKPSVADGTNHNDAEGKNIMKADDMLPDDKHKQQDKHTVQETSNITLSNNMTLLTPSVTTPSTTSKVTTVTTTVATTVSEKVTFNTISTTTVQSEISNNKTAANETKKKKVPTATLR